MSNIPPELKKTDINAEQREELDTAFAKARAALAIIETYDQARVDRLCQAVAWAVSNKKTFTRLVAEGIAESRLGDPDSRMGKRMKIRGILRDALRQKSVGIIEEIPEKGIVKYGKPAGVVACIVPTTNPDLTPAGNAIYGIKARDAVIFSPHPRAKKTSFETVRLMREALEKEGAPPDLLQCLTRVNIPMSQALMAEADLVIATGGQPMVRAAYSSGTPAYGVGAGNSTMVIDETANIEEAAYNTRLSKTSDFGSGCSADGNLIIQAGVFDALLARCKKKAATWPTRPKKKPCAKPCGMTKATAWPTRWRLRHKRWLKPPVSAFPQTASSSSCAETALAKTTRSHAKSSPHCWRFTSTARLTKP
jgi:sulfoacetaldehyde dehydrogenase